LADRTFVAVKSLRQDGNGADESAGNQFLAELELMKGLRHPQIVQLIGAVTESQPQMLVLEFLAGGALDDWLRENWGRGLHGSQLDRSLHQIALGMGALNAAGIVHRDLASRNVLVGEGLSCKVADFGLSRTMASSQKEYYKFNEGRLISLRWTAPECLTQLKWTSASDVYSFGVLISEVYAAGAFPFDALTDTAVVEFVTVAADPVESKLIFSWQGGPSSSNAVSTAAACLVRDPASRPTFNWLANAFLPQNIIAESVAATFGLLEEERCVSASDIATSTKASVPPAALGSQSRQSPATSASAGNVDADSYEMRDTHHGSFASVSDDQADHGLSRSFGTASADRGAGTGGTAEGGAERTKTAGASLGDGYLDIEAQMDGIDETSL
jgi:serine/threonine protein kinase